VQIAREVNLQRAAQAGVVKLESKGGGEGDAVSLEVTGKQIPGDVTVTVRAEFTVPDRLDEENRAAVRDGLAGIAATFGGGFDVGAKSNELPGYEGVARLLALNATIQPSLTESVAGMQAAIWNLTDASPLETSGTADASRALMAQAGVAEDSVPGGLPALGNPNAGSPATATVGAAGAVLPPVAAQAVTPAVVRLDAAQLYPARLRSVPSTPR
jgi:hypothetical protein